MKTEYKSREKRMEREANYFARCLLIPEVLLYKEIEPYKSYQGGYGMSRDNILNLSKKFAVEPEVMTMRLMELDIIG